MKPHVIAPVGVAQAWTPRFRSSVRPFPLASLASGVAQPRPFESPVRTASVRETPAWAELVGVFREPEALKSFEVGVGQRETALFRESTAPRCPPQCSESSALAVGHCFAQVSREGVPFEGRTCPFSFPFWLEP